jgi:hypothetical protein
LALAVWSAPRVSKSAQQDLTGIQRSELEHHWPGKGSALESMSHAGQQFNPKLHNRLGIIPEGGDGSSALPCRQQFPMRSQQRFRRRGSGQVGQGESEISHPSVGPGCRKGDLGKRSYSRICQLTGRT